MGKKKKNKKAKLNSNATGLVPFTGSESSRREGSRRSGHSAPVYSGQDEEYGRYVDYTNSNLNTDFNDIKNRPQGYFAPRPILNMDFYNAYRETMIFHNEIKASSKKPNEIVYAGDPKHKKVQKKMETNLAKYGKASTLSVISTVLPFLVIPGFSLFILVQFLIELSTGIEYYFPGFIKGALILIAEVVLNILAYKFLKKRYRKKQLALLQENDNYYALCKDLTFAESDRISYRFPTRKIDSSYPSLYADIDKEWKETSHNFITDESFRLAPFNYSFGKNSKYRFFVEIKYEPCFPDYPALLGLEQSMERLCLLSKEDLNPGKKYKNYKMQVKDYVSGYLKERIPALKVKEINVAIGLRSMFDWP